MTSGNEVVARWVALKKERGCLPRTIQQYRWIVRKAFTFLKRAGRPTDPRKWSSDDARWLRRRLKEDPWRLSTLADLARFSRNFVFYEVGLPRPGPPRRVRWLSEEQVRTLFEVVRGDRLLRLVALLGVGQGLRRVEWLRLRVGDLDFAGERLLVRGKGRGQPKLVWMPMHPELPGALREYLDWRTTAVRRFLRRHPLSPVPEEVFLHWRGRRLVAYGEGGANAWMGRLERRLNERGCDVKLSTHMLRRSGATLLERTLLRSPEASRDGVYRSVQEFLRHDNLATTMRYLETDPSRQRRAMAVFGRAFDWSGPVPTFPRPPEGTPRRRARSPPVEGARPRTLTAKGR